MSGSVVIFPGMDGTDQLLDNFCALVTTDLPARVLALPDDPRLSYEDLVDHFAPIFEALRASGDKCVLIGESFSGPLVILLADRFPEVVNHLVLVATFVTPPVPRFCGGLAKLIPWGVIFQRPMPRWVAKRLIGSHDDLLPVLQAAVKVQSPATLANRLERIQRVDVRSALAGLQCPVTCLRATKDAAVAARHGDRIAKLNPRVTLIEVEGPHWIL